MRKILDQASTTRRHVEYSPVFSINPDRNVGALELTGECIETDSGSIPFFLEDIMSQIFLVVLDINVYIIQCLQLVLSI